MTDMPTTDTPTTDTPPTPARKGRILNVGPFITTGETADGKLITGGDENVRRQLGLIDDEHTKAAKAKAAREQEMAARKADGAAQLPDAEAKADAAEQDRVYAHEALVDAVHDNPITAAYLAYVAAERKAQTARAAASSARDLANLGHDRGMASYTPKYPTLTDALDKLGKADR